ncbi:hypothetical protein [Amycolatopsis vastitatis]|uniref:hypothetical protein n=1 Tax=Amycolatopsis vastitatis TaxID=1905142 RepID=UPI001177CAA7|nr:hypothetical protein [Amycolatopsis vastitatis]
MDVDLALGHAGQGELQGAGNRGFRVPAVVETGEDRHLAGGGERLRQRKFVRGERPFQAEAAALEDRVDAQSRQQRHGRHQPAAGDDADSLDDFRLGEVQRAEHRRNRASGFRSSRRTHRAPRQRTRRRPGASLPGTVRAAAATDSAGSGARVALIPRMALC